MFRYLASFSLVLSLYVNLFAQCQVMLVAADTTDADVIRILDAIEQSQYQIKVHFVLAESLANMTEEDFQPYDVAVISENGGSTSLGGYAPVGIRAIPFVCLKAYAIKKSYPRWNWITGDADRWWMSPKDSSIIDPSYDEVYSGVVAADHEIWSDMYTIGDEFEWTESYNENEGDEAHIQCFDLKKSYSAIADNATLIATNKFAQDETSSEVDGWLWVVEENDSSKRGVIWGIHHQYLNNATETFFQIIRNSVFWAIGSVDLSCGIVISDEDTDLWWIRVNDDPICHFEAGCIETHYDYILPDGTSTIPTISCNPHHQDATIEILNATNLYGSPTERTTRIIVTSADQQYTQDYTVTFTVGPDYLTFTGESPEVKIFPIPAADELQLKSNLPIDRILVFNLSGIQVMESRRAGEELINMDISFLSEGVYILKVFSGEHVINKKFLKH